MNQYVSRSSILVHYVVLFRRFWPFFRLRCAHANGKTDIGSQSL